jgi:hypothetical protein
LRQQTQRAPSLVPPSMWVLLLTLQLRVLALAPPQPQLQLQARPQAWPLWVHVAPVVA